MNSDETQREQPVEYPRYCWVMFIVGTAFGLLMSMWAPMPWFGR